MAATVRQNDIVDALEMQFDESSSFLDRHTGQVETVSHVLLREAEESGDDEEPNLPTWQKQEWEIARRIVSSDRFQKLPTKFEVHEWAIMQDFSHSVESEGIRSDVLYAIRGGGAFRNFQGHPPAAPHRISLVCVPRGGLAADRTQLVRRESDRLGVVEFPG